VQAQIKTLGLRHKASADQNRPAFARMTRLQEDKSYGKGFEYKYLTMILDLYGPYRLYGLLDALIVPLCTLFFF